MKAQLYSQKGEKVKTIDLPAAFNSVIREDLVQKYYEAEKLNSRQLYAPAPEAGRRHSASGTISHLRHDWKGHYGKGISRVPRKTMWRRGTQFFWIGAEISSARGGRRAHPPRLDRAIRKINSKEVELAIKSALAATASANLIARRYSSIDKIESAPFVIEALPKKTKEFLAALKQIFGKLYDLTAQKKVVRSGKGKGRGRKYKSTAGLLIVTATDEEAKFSGFDVVSLDDLSIQDLFPLGRLTLYTKKALDELSKENKQ